VTFYGKSRRRCTTKIPEVVSGEREQVVQLQSTKSSSKSTSRKRLRSKETHQPDDSRELTADEDLHPATKSGVSARGRSVHSDIEFKWKRQTSKTKTETLDYMYGHVNLNFDDCRY